MGLLARIKNVIYSLRGVGVAEPKLQRIGNTDPVCPFCDHKLAQMPRENEKCPNCGESLFVRKRPIDEKLIVVTESQIQVVEEQWSIADGSYEQVQTKRDDREDKTTTDEIST